MTSVTRGNPITPAAGTTDSTGRVVFNYTGNAGPSDILRAQTAFAAPRDLLITVSEFELAILEPAQNSLVEFDVFEEVRVRLRRNNVAQGGEQIRLATTRGVFEGSDESITLTTNTADNVPVAGLLAGEARTRIRVDTSIATGPTQNGRGQAGPATITATASGDDITADRTIVFVATEPTRVDLQAEPAIIPVQGTSEVRAVVRDIEGNLVQSQAVLFSLSDATSGSLNTARAVTDIQGTATVVYTASGTQSGGDGRSVRVTGRLEDNSAITNFVGLTVGGQALRIALGTGNTLIDDPEDPAIYRLPFVAIVTDSSGNPPPADTVFRLSVLSAEFQKGIYIPVDVTGDGENDRWAPLYSVVNQDTDRRIESLGPDLSCPAGSFQVDDTTPLGTFTANDGCYVTIPADPRAIGNAFGCEREDVDLDGVLDPGEDVNQDGALTPTNVVTVPDGQILLDESGVARFELTYPQEYANWLQVELKMVASVSGTETTEYRRIVLPVTAADVALSTTPPGATSPFGSNSRCDSPL